MWPILKGRTHGSSTNRAGYPCRKNFRLTASTIHPYSKAFYGAVDNCFDETYAKPLYG